VHALRLAAFFPPVRGSWERGRAEPGVVGVCPDALPGERGCRPWGRHPHGRGSVRGRGTVTTAAGPSLAAAAFQSEARAKRLSTTLG